MKNAFLISFHPSEFVIGDQIILEESFRVEVFYIENDKDFIKVLYKNLKLLSKLLRNRRKIELIYIWFADYYSFIPCLIGNLFKIRTIIILGGSDVVKDNELNYGVHTNFIRSKLSLHAIKLASLLLPVSLNTKKKLDDLSIKNFIDKSSVVYNGVKPLKLFSFNEISKSERQFDFVSVCSGSSLKRIRLKGIEVFLKLARLMRCKIFLIIGLSDVGLDYIKSQNLSNVITIGPQVQKRLYSLLLLSKTICQLSRHEAFGLAMAEGMYCGCIPVTFEDLGAAELIDINYGYLANRHQLHGLSMKMEASLRADSNWRYRNHRRIIDHFSMAARKQALEKIILDEV